MPQGLRLVPLSTVLALLALILLGSLLSAACFWGEDPTRPPDPTPTATATTAPETEPTRPP